MKTKLIQIWNHFGEVNQLMKLEEEVKELIEAILENDIDHIEEEFADVLVCLDQIKEAKELSELNIATGYAGKIMRTIKRIKEGFYEEKSTL